MNALQEARTQLTARRDALNAAIVALDGVIAMTDQPLVTLPPPAGARPPRQRREKPVRKPAPAAARRQSPPKRVTKPVPTAVRSEAATARADAILAALKRNDGLGTSKVLRAAMPKEPGLNEEQRDDAYRNTMTRLKSRGLINRTGDTWSLVGIGSERG